MHSHPILAGSSLLLPSVPRETEPTRRAFRSQVPPSSLIRTALTLEAGAREAKELPVESTGEARATRLPAIPSPLLLSNPVRRRESGGSFSTAGSSPASQSEAKASSRPTVEKPGRSRLLWRRCPSSSSRLKSTCSSTHGRRWGAKLHPLHLLEQQEPRATSQLSAWFWTLAFSFTLCPATFPQPGHGFP